MPRSSWHAPVATASMRCIVRMDGTRLGCRVAFGVLDLVLDFNRDVGVAAGSAIYTYNEVRVEKSVTGYGHCYGPAFAHGIAMPPAVKA